MSIAISNEFGFLGIAKLRVKVTKGVGYKDAFFLVKNTLKILLSQPFIIKIKINIKYRNNSLQDRIFTNLDNNRNIYTIIIVLPLKKDIKRLRKGRIKGY